MLRRRGLFQSIVILTVLSAIILASVSFIDGKHWIGTILVFLGIGHIMILNALERASYKAVLPDIVFGLVDNGLLVAGAVIGAEFAGIFGAVVGAAAMNTVTDGLAGLFEGVAVEHLRSQKIRQKRTALTTSIGKMAGCLIGAGAALILFWNILGF